MSRAQPQLPVAGRLPAEAAASAGRVGYDLTAAKPLLHTAIDKDGYEALRAASVVRAETHVSGV